MQADAWSEWAGRAPGAPPGMPSGSAFPSERDDLHGLIVRWTARLLGTNDVLLWLVDEDGRRLVVRDGVGRFSASVGCWLDKGEGLAGEVWQAGRPLAMTEGLSTPPRLRRVAGVAGTRMWRRGCARRWSLTGRSSGC